MSALSAVDPARTPLPRGSVGMKTLVVVFVGVALSAGLMWLVTLGLNEPSRVDVTVANPTDYIINVHVRPGDGGGGHGIGTLAPRSTRTFKEIADQGEQWRFDFNYAGIEGASVLIPRARVAADVITVPGSVAAEFAEAGLRPRPTAP